MALLYRGNSETFISYFSGMWNWQEWLFDQNFKTFWVVLLPFLSLFLSQLHGLVCLWFDFSFFSWILLFFVFKKYPGSFILLQTLLEVITHSWKWWGLVTYQFCYWSRTRAVLNPAVLSLTIFRCLRRERAFKTNRNQPLRDSAHQVVGSLKLVDSFPWFDLKKLVPNLEITDIRLFL